MPGFLLAFTFILVHVSGVLGCSCAYIDDQTKYCRSAYVVTARVKDFTFEGAEATTRRTFDVDALKIHNYFTFEQGVDVENAGRIYDVDVLKVYKGNVTTGPAKVHTDGVASLCGVRLSRKLHLLNGYFENGQMWIHSCNFITYKPLMDPSTPLGFDPSHDCRCKKENIVVREGQPKPKKVCALGKRLRCPPVYHGAPSKLAECRYNVMQDDCDWHC